MPASPAGHVKPPRPSIQKLAERLISSDDADHEVSELSHEECLELDSIAFECQRCNLWFHQRDNATKNDPEWICKGCAE